MPRLFVGIEPGESARAALAAYLEQCRLADPAVRWVPPRNLHLTLRFLGQVDDVTPLRAELGSITGAAFEASLGAPGTFRNRGGAVAWLGVATGAEDMLELSRAVNAAVSRAGTAPEDRPLRPHLTLGRGRKPQVELPPPPSIPPWRVESFALFESRPGSGAPVYSIVERYPLDAG